MPSSPSDVQSRRACGLARTPPICSRGRSAHFHGLNHSPAERQRPQRYARAAQDSARFQSHGACINVAARRKPGERPSLMSTTIDRSGSGALPAESSVGYQVGVVILLSITFGILFFDRNSLGFLQPFVQPVLGLSNTQVGLLASVLSLTWAFAAFGIGVVSDRTGSRKRVLLLSTLAFSVCSFLSGLAGSFVMLLAARALMGIAEGGVMPIAQAIIASEVKPEHRGLAMGVTQNFGSNLLGSFVAPLALTGFATAFGWRHAFYLAGL